MVEAWMIVAVVGAVVAVAIFFYGGRNEARRQLRERLELARLVSGSYPHARPRGWQP